MSEKIEVLRRLQSIDTKLRRLEGDKLYRSHDIEKKKEEIQQKRAELANIDQKAKDYHRDIGMKELDLRTKEEEINKLRIQMNQVKTNKEYSALRKDIGGKEADKSVLEDKILEMITVYEEMRKKYNSFEKELENEEKSLQELQKQVEADIKKMDTEIANLKERRNKYAAMTDNETLQQYNRLVSHKDAIAVVGVVNKVCQGCFLSVTSQTVNQLMSGKGLTYCHSCGRILYLEDESGKYDD